MSLSRFTPKQFLCLYPLSRGVLVYAIILMIVAILCVTVLAVEMIGFNSCTSTDVNGKQHSRRIAGIIMRIAKCLERIIKNSYAFNGTAIINSIILLIFQVCVMWAVKKGKASVVLLWAVLTSIWLVQVFCLFIVLLIMYMNDNSIIAWALCAAFGLLGFCLAAYGIAVGLGLWLEMKTIAGDAST